MFKQIFINNNDFYNDIIDLSNNQPKIKFKINDNLYKINNIHNKIIQNNKNTFVLKLYNENIIDNTLNIISQNDYILLLNINNIINVFYIFYYILQCYSILNDNNTYNNILNDIFNKNYICTYKNIKYMNNDFKKNNNTCMTKISLFDKNILKDLFEFINIDMNIYISYIKINPINPINPINKNVIQYYNLYNKICINCKNNNVINKTNEIFINKNKCNKDEDIIINKNKEKSINKEESTNKKEESINEIINKFDYYYSLLKKNLLEKNMNN